MEQDPFFAVHNLESEAEAALAHDYATLWLCLRCPGCTLESLSSQKWNLPQMRVWEDAHAVRALARLGIDEAKGAQKYIRTKMSAQAAVLAERGLLRKERVQRLDRHQKELEKWRETCTREEQEKEEQRAAVWREAQAAAQRIELQHAEHGQTAKTLLAELKRSLGPQKAAEPANRRREVRQQAKDAEKRAQAEARIAHQNAAEPSGWPRSGCAGQRRRDRKSVV